jgi:maleate isomerase
MLTPSSNTVLEPVTCALVASLPDVTAHFSRFRVVEISLDETALSQFSLEPMLEAAKLLADASVDVIAWNGTSGGWLGFDADRRLCSLIERETGARATTSVLALNEVFRRRGVRRFGLVTPYSGDVQERIVANYARLGLGCAGERHLGLTENTAFAAVPAAKIRELVRDVAAARPDAITTFCTNLRAAPLVAELERELGVAVYDTISVVVWHALELAGVDPVRVGGWGSLFNPLGSRRG